MSAAVVLELLLAAALLGWGGWLLAARMPLALLARKATAWRKTAATLRVTSLQTARGRGTSFRVLVRYSYQVEGSEVAGERIHHCYTPSARRLLHKGIFNRLQSGSVIAVHFDPERPEQSTILAGVNRDCLLYALAGVPLIVLGGLLGLHGLLLSSDIEVPDWLTVCGAFAALVCATVAAVSWRAHDRLLADVARVL
ncbi:DUF3592 domain-containing protein [Aquabacterium sp. A7-Y]|uniref:DUF3592 domain-containing protein n=1 Tax=Aquabacterium sp. A7-Y TaxID=1349605 RepID=UPI00223CD7D1|nr:DUF3592 domain-containing protein [Aquabacterium sp. A7-Y]MCW7539630.1 DUF3592 domain-containing protein [Aquabacterium sp. A7-Y]